MSAFELMSGLQIAEGFLPVNMATAANAGDWVSMENYRNLAVVLFKGPGTAAEDPTLTIEQATSAAGGSAKALNFTDVLVKQAATNLQAVGQFTRVTQASGNTYTEATGAEQAAIWIVEIAADMLDKANGFKFVRGSVADVGTNSQIGGLLYLLGNPRYQNKPESLLSALA